MLSPAPIPLLCALLLSLPLAFIFTITGPNLPHSTTTTTSGTPLPTSTLPPNKTDLNPPSPPLPNTPPLLKTHEKTLINNMGPTVPLPLPPPPLPPRPIPVPSSQFGNNDGGDDEEEDNELFRLASRVNPNPKPMKKVAFLFLTTSPLPFAPLWEMFFNHTPKNLYNIYIHADPTSNYKTPFSGVFSGRVIPSKPTRRNTPTLVAAARRLIAHALIHDASNYMFSLLSPSCIPLHSFNFTYKTLTRSRKSFIEILKDEPGAYDRWAARGEDAMIPVVRFEEFRIGSQFFVMKRKHARLVVRDRRLWSKFKLPCLTIGTCYPEEHYFPTLLKMVDPRGCIPATLTHVDWSRSRDSHPRMYGKEEVGPELIRTLRRSRPRYGQSASNGSDWSVGKRHDPFLFARKFSPETIESLMEMANDVIFKR